MVIVEHRNRPPLTAKALKVTLVLSPAEILTVPAPDRTPRCIVRIAVAGRIVTADLNAKSVRKAQTAIRTAGVDGVACILQGRLEEDNSLAEAGLTVQPKVVKAQPPPPNK